MTRRWLNFIATAALTPLAVSVSPALRDSSVTSLTIAAGSGDYAYVTRGCDNEVLTKQKLHFRDSGIEVKHEFRGPLAAGVRMTVLNEMPEYDKGSVVVNPNIAMEWDKVGLGLGGTFVPDDNANGQPDYKIPRASAHIRVGQLTKLHASIHLGEDIPLTSGGGAYRIGAGFRPLKDADLWLGLGGYPYDKAGFIVRADYHATPYLDLHATGRLGSSEGIKENAVSAGVTVKLTHGR
jgi:hypothetical protein